MPGIMEVSDENEPEKNTLLKLAKRLLSKDPFGGNGVNLVATIAKLELSHCNLQEVPACIKTLKLKELKLSHNDLRVVPICLYTGLETLEHLDLSHNMLENFDIEPACCPTLRRLAVSHNQIYNFPQWISMGQAPNLTDIVYTDNKMRQFRLPMHKLNVETLELASCMLLDEDFSFLVQLTKLKKLVIGNLAVHAEDTRANSFKDLDAFISNFFAEELQVLHLNHLSLTMIPCDLYWNDRLVELHLAGCDIFVIGPDVKYLTRLRALDVSHNCLSALPQELCMLEALRVLKAPCNLIDTVPKFGSKLEVLDLYDNRMDVFPQFDHGLPPFIDLEQNFMDTASVEWHPQYLERKTQLRQMTGLDGRSDGSRNVENCWESSSSSTLSSLSFEDCETSMNNRDNESIQYFKDNENWDEELQTIGKKQIERHPDVSPSDDEWEALEPLMKYQPKIYERFAFPPDPDEDWIFCDVQLHLNCATE